MKFKGHRNTMAKHQWEIYKKFVSANVCNMQNMFKFAYK